MNLHHIGYIVYDAENTSVVEGTLQQVASVIDPLQHAKINLYKNQIGELIELIQPLEEKSPVWNFLHKHGNKFHHHCYTGTPEELDTYIHQHQLVKIMGPMTAKIFDPHQVEFYIDKDSNITEFIF